MNAYLATQFSGPVIQAIADGLQASFDATAPLIAYWSTMDLSTATGPELDFMGEIAGFPRPLVPQDFFGLNTFHLGDSALWEQTSTSTGLGDTGDPTVGGQLGDVFPAVSSSMPDSWYRQMIPILAELKYYGITLYTVDLVVGTIAAISSVTYTIAQLANGDVKVTFGSAVSYPFLWILNNAFPKYETTFVVTIANP
jgi:hypothetical protein